MSIKYGASQDIKEIINVHISKRAQRQIRKLLDGTWYKLGIELLFRNANELIHFFSFN